MMFVLDVRVVLLGVVLIVVRNVGCSLKWLMSVLIWFFGFELVVVCGMLVVCSLWIRFVMLG